MMERGASRKECRIILGEANAEIHRIISQILSPDFEIAAVATDGDSLLAAESQIEPTLIIADIRIPGLSALKAWQGIRQRNPACKMIFISIDGDHAYRMAAIEAEADGWLLKATLPAELPAALRLILGGGRYLQ